MGANGRVGYKIPENPTEIKEVIQAASEGREYVPPHSFLALWIVGSGVILLFATFGVFLLVSRRRQHSPGQQTLITEDMPEIIVGLEQSERDD
jgi:hypothetical protein